MARAISLSVSCSRRASTSSSRSVSVPARRVRLGAGVSAQGPAQRRGRRGNGRIGPRSARGGIEQREHDRAVPRERPGVVGFGEQPQIVRQVGRRAVVGPGAVFQDDRQRQAPHPGPHQTAFGGDRLQRGGELAGRIDVPAGDEEPKPRARQHLHLPPALGRDVEAFRRLGGKPVEPPRPGRLVHLVSGEQHRDAEHRKEPRQ